MRTATQTTDTVVLAEPIAQFQWAKYATMSCGAWLVANTIFTRDFTQAILINDLVCGILVVVLSWLALAPKRDWVRWFNGVIGTWLLFAPLVLWAPNAFTYNNDTLMGTLIIAFAFLIPGQPGALATTGSDIPPGWSYNPSSWTQRIPLITIAFLGFFLARYLAAYQLGHIAYPWDPFFGDGTRKVLESEVSRAFIVSDAALGAVAYLIDALEGFLGRGNRWRTMPWAVVVFAASIVPAGITSIVLVMLQPISVGAWCTLCLITAAAMLIMVPFAFDELVATGQFMMQKRREGKSLWRTFFLGDDGYDVNTTSAVEERREHGFTGITVPFTLAVSALVGIWIMASPAVLGITGTASDGQHLIGALVVTFAVTAMAEPCRIVRFLNVVLALALLFGPVVLTGFTPEAILANILVGVTLIVLSLPRGRIENRYGSWERFIV